ncbi:MAG TPA: efflux RND transporter periplasmic adaptor subunit [Longimicrobiales bacterium]|nr:efflux RND transporter periplasmic adaptor subunit [Longimicrobiales bacterium]
MRLSKRLATAFAIVLVLSLSGAGVYLRINGHSAAATGGGGATGDLPDVSATEQFAADLAVPVEGAEVLLDTLVLAVTATGEAASMRQTTLRAQVTGQVRAVRVRENRNVAAGAVLVEIDPTEYQLALDEARARLREAEARYREITLGDDRIDDAGVRADRDSAARARSGLDVARVAVQRAEINLSRTRVTAPFGGSIANLQVVEGQHVTQGEELLVVQAMDPIRVEAQVLEGDIGFLQPGRRAAVTFAAFPGEIFDGVIESINPVVDQQTRTARATVTVRNPGGRVLPGMYARVSLSARRFADRVMVPRDAILERDRRTMLFVFRGEGEQGRTEWRYVNTGLMNDHYVEILEEGEEDGMVRPGEIVLVSGHRTLQHDIPVRLVANARAEGGRTQ